MGCPCSSELPLPLEKLETPALLLDLAAVERNLSRMMSFLAGAPAKIRPHFKNHQCLWLARRQMELGAIGISCATVGQAARLVDAGIGSILIANEVVAESAIRQFAELSLRAQVIFAIDNRAVAADAGRIARATGRELSVLVDIDTGMKRCGVPPPEALDLARHAAAQGLRVPGIMAYEGFLQHVAPGPEKQRRCREALAFVPAVTREFHAAGLGCEIVSAGGTGSYSAAAHCPGVTELQPGSFAAMDTSYREFAPEFEPALSVLATVISKPERGRCVLDCGRKAISGERGLPLVRTPGSLRVAALHSEHAILISEGGADSPEPGALVELWVHYSDPTVQLHPALHLVGADRIVTAIERRL